MSAAIDLHCHIFCPAWLQLARSHGSALGTSFHRGPDGREWVRAPGDFNYPVSEELWSVDGLVAALPRRHLSGAALSIAPPTLSYWAEPGLAGELAAAMNDDLAAAVSRWPDRLVALATVPLQDPARAVAELQRVMRDPRFRGVMIGSHVGARNLDDPDLLPFWEACQALGACVFIHPYEVLGSERLQRYYLWNAIGMVTETAVAIESMIFGGVYARFPALRTYFAHGGGTFPWIRGRAEHAFHAVRTARFEVSEPPSAFLRWIYVDSLCFLPHALEWLVQELGSQQIVIGSDYPFDMGPEDPTALLRCSRLSEGQREDMAWRTAAQLLQLRAGELGIPGTIE